MFISGFETLNYKVANPKSVIISSNFIPEVA
jgi:hypothetical protein